MPVTPRKYRELRRPPFENRWGAGGAAWRWYVELERLGPAHVRACLARLAIQDDEPLDPPWAAPTGFVHDWLAYLERRDQRNRLGWRLAIFLVALAAAIAAAIAAAPVLGIWR